MTERVAITGIGVFSPIGNTVDQVLASLHKGISGLVTIAHLDQFGKDAPIGKDLIQDFLTAAESAAAGLPGWDNDTRAHLFRYLTEFLNSRYNAHTVMSRVRYIGKVRDFSPRAYFSPREIKKTDRFQQLALAASEAAKIDAGLAPQVGSHFPTERVGVVAGSSMGGMISWEEAFAQFMRNGIDGIPPYFLMKQPVDTAAGEISRRQRAHGPIECPVAACATGALVVGRAYEWVKRGLVDIAFAAASDAGLSYLGLGGFEALNALSTADYGNPARASRPFDRKRSGFVMAEGAGCLIVENMEKARKRGARIYAEIIGFGNYADAFHPTRPNPEGHFAALSMAQALKDGNIRPEEVDYINAHGTSTVLNDVMETKAIKKAFGADLADTIPVSSTKSMSGHMMGAAGVFEAAICALALFHQFIPPTINYEHPDPECNLADYVPNQAREADLRVVLSNSFGFGGRDATIALKKFS